ncbi:protein FAM8A1 [Scophthalmus maximus]|uniref:Family with sequence similarity 8 member A1a n=1 Tax=Scophthalmus maximus TaxID=52904 RepID=A0A8D3A512_SCOMX|nr:protein FAM8A1 [Scophthalmus maximus]
MEHPAVEPSTTHSASVTSGSDMFAMTTTTTTGDGDETGAKRPEATATAEYCAELQRWMWQYYCGHASWQSWVALSAFPFPPPCPFLPPGTSAQTPGAAATANSGGGGPQVVDPRSWYTYPQYPHGFPASSDRAGGAQSSAQDQTVNPAPQAGREYTIPSPLQRFLAETVDFFILFCVKATIVLWVMHLSGMKDIAKLVTQFIVEEIDENTSMEDLQKMMAAALVYRVLVCVYETICIWGAGGATPGKFLLGLRVVTCDTSTLVRPNRVFVVPASNVSLSASTVRALNKNFSIAFLFPVFITLLFFQHNRTVYDIVAGTIVVQRRGGT